MQIIVVIVMMIIENSISGDLRLLMTSSRSNCENKIFVSFKELREPFNAPIYKKGGTILAEVSLFTQLHGV